MILGSKQHDVFENVNTFFCFHRQRVEQPASYLDNHKSTSFSLVYLLHQYQHLYRLQRRTRSKMTIIAQDLQEPPIQPQKKVPAQTEEWPPRNSLFFNPRFPNNVSLPAPQRTVLPPSDQINDKLYHPETGKVSLQPHPTNTQPGALGIQSEKKAAASGI